MGEKYEIKTVADFLKVPADRQADCLSEFGDFLGMARAMLELTAICGELVGVAAAGRVDAFVWIDDGKRDKTVTIRAEEKGGAA